MMTQLFFTGSLLAAGLYFILADVLKLPTMKTAKAMLGAGKENKKAAKTVEAWLMSGAVKLLLSSKNGPVLANNFPPHLFKKSVFYERGASSHHQSSVPGTYVSACPAKLL